eukprot:scaffold1006_cov408-Prasinococcus_capsulatus_cf.AAC.23
MYVQRHLARDPQPIDCVRLPCSQPWVVARSWRLTEIFVTKRRRRDELQVHLVDEVHHDDVHDEEELGTTSRPRSASCGRMRRQQPGHAVAAARQRGNESGASASSAT